MASNTANELITDVGEVLSKLEDVAAFLNETQRSRYLHPMIKTEMWSQEQSINRVLKKHV